MTNNFRIAYLISAYKDPLHLKRLCDVLNYNMSNVHFFIHVDKKVDISQFANLVKNDNIHYVKKRYWSNWGGANQVLYQKEMLRCALAFQTGDFKFDRFVIMTGQDYPLMSNLDLCKLFSDPNRKFMIGENLTKDCHDEKYMERITLYHFLRDIHVRNVKLKQFFSYSARKIMRLLPIRKGKWFMVRGKRWDVYYASSYMDLSNEAATLIYDELCNNKALYRYFRFSNTPEETVIPTIVFNTKLSKKATLLPSWKRGLIRVSNLEQFDYGKSIKIYTEDDYEELINCRKPFARKLETGKSDKLMDLLDIHNGIAKH